MTKERKVKNFTECEFERIVKSSWYHMLGLRSPINSLDLKSVNK